MIAFLAGGLWGIAVLASFVGWGWLLGMGLMRGNRHVACACAVWGVAWSVLVGGLLNLLGWVSPVLLQGYVGLGLLLCTLAIARRSFPEQETPRGLSGPAALLAVLAFLVAGLQYVAWIATPGFNWHDDYQGYFLFPFKLMQTGSLGLDPYSEHRLVALGSQSFLQTLTLCVLPARSMHLLDLGLGLLMTLGMLHAIWRRQGISRTWICCGLLLLLMLPAPRANISGTMIPMALLLGWCDVREKGPRGAILAGLLLGALATIKHTLLPIAMLLWLMGPFLASRAWPMRLRYGLLQSLAMLIVLLPWLLAMHQTAGTMLYPLLGTGNNQPVFSALGPLSAFSPQGILEALRTSLHPYVLVLLVVMILTPLAHVSEGRRMGFALCALVAVFPLALMNEGLQMRYAYPFVVPALLLCLIPLIQRWQSRKTWVLLLGILCLLPPAATLWSYAEGKPWKYLRDNPFVRNISFGLSGKPLVPVQERWRYAGMQASIPAGEILMARLERPFLLNLRRNPVYVVDVPGGTVIPRGLPFFQGPVRLRDYLLEQGIRYVAFSYGSQARGRKEDNLHLLEDPNPWTRSLARHAFDFQDNLNALGTAHPRLYDDGAHWLIDVGKEK